MSSYAKIRLSSDETETELDSVSSELKGKGRYVAALDEGDDLHEDTPIEDSDDEVENLLRKGQEEDNSRVQGEQEGVKSRRRRSKSVGSVGETKSAGGWRSMTGVGFSGISKRDRQQLVNEMLRQTLPILGLSLIGSIFTGLLLANLQEWRVFIRIEELFILVPILLNLKGNLEMILSSRFSTSANIGELDMRRTRRSLILGNLALLQVQALLVSFISGLLAFLLGTLSRNGVHHGLQHPIHNPSSSNNAAAGGMDVTDSLRGGYFEVLLVLCVSMLGTSLSSAVLGSFMCALVVMCRRFRVNPDNIATPLASTLGDLVTLIIVGGVSTLFAQFMGTLVSTAVFIILLGAIAVNAVITFRNAYVQELLTVGWGPLFVAMAISSGAGLVLEAYVNEFDGFALFAPVLTSLVGNAGSIFVSRISTSLHSSKKEHYLLVSLALFLITGPILCLFLFFIWVTGQAPVTFVFALSFVVVVCLELAFALSIAYNLSLLLWRWDYDPDVYALPLLSSVIDVTGQLMLVAAFTLARRSSGDVALVAVDTGAL